MSKDTEAKYIDSSTGEVRRTLVLTPVPTPDVVHEWFHAGVKHTTAPTDDGGDDDDQVPRVEPTIYPGWAANRRQSIYPGPMRQATRTELNMYNERMMEEGEPAARAWLTDRWHYGN